MPCSAQKSHVKEIVFPSQYSGLWQTVWCIAVASVLWFRVPVAGKAADISDPGPWCHCWWDTLDDQETTLVGMSESDATTSDRNVWSRKKLISVLCCLWMHTRRICKYYKAPAEPMQRRNLSVHCAILVRKVTLYLLFSNCVGIVMAVICREIRSALKSTRFDWDGPDDTAGQKARGNHGVAACRHEPPARILLSPPPSHSLAQLQIFKTILSPNRQFENPVIG